ncbi:MAG TPA: hypothetical protein O0X27_04695 [Methanocorpusculum sp.]|nr:hypothetical protein [Methanocorpusculum sp.]
MPETRNSPTLCTQQEQPHTLFPASKLQTLNRRVGKKQLYFDKEQFAASVTSWSGIPLIFQKDGIHPDFAEVTRDPEHAADLIGGMLVGSVHNPQIVTEGGPRLMAELDVDTCGDELHKLWEDGTLTLSTAFYAKSDGDRITAPPVPNHVLLFPYQVDRVLPGDFGAFVNTMEAPAMLPEKPTEDTRPAKVGGFFQALAELLTRSPELKEAMANAEPAGEPIAEPVPAAEEEIAELKKQIEELKAAVAASEQINAELKAELEALRLRETEQKFSVILNALPDGMKATEAQILAIRNSYNAGKIEDVLLDALKHSVSAGVTAKTGVPFAHSEPAPREEVGDLSAVGDRR